MSRSRVAMNQNEAPTHRSAPHPRREKDVSRRERSRAQDAAEPELGAPQSSISSAM